MLVVAFEFTGAARSFMINSLCDQKGWTALPSLKHWSNVEIERIQMLKQTFITTSHFTCHM